MCTSKIAPKKILLSILLVFSAIVSAEENNPCLHNNTGFCGVPLKPENLQSLTLSYPVPTADAPADVRSLVRSAVNSKRDSKTLPCKICGEKIECKIDITQVTIITGNNTYTGKGTARGNVYLRCSRHAENETFSTRIVPFTIKFEDTDDDDNDCSSGHSHDWSDWSYHCELESPSQESYSIYNTDTALRSFIKEKANDRVKDKSYKSKICGVCQKERKENYSHSADWLCGYYSIYHSHNQGNEMMPQIFNGKHLYCVRMDSSNCAGEFAVIPVWIQQTVKSIEVNNAEEHNSNGLELPTLPPREPAPSATYITRVYDQEKNNGVKLTAIANFGEWTSNNVSWEYYPHDPNDNNRPYIYYPDTEKSDEIEFRATSPGTYVVVARCNYGDDENLSAQAKAVTIVVLDIALNFPNPIPATPAIGETPESRGYDTILISNIADESSSAKRPDYANFDDRNDTSLLQLNMNISVGNLSREKLKIKFEYDGIEELASCERAAITGDSIKDIFMRGDKQYWDYTPFKKGLIRVWASSKPFKNASTWHSEKVITGTSSRDPQKYGVGTGNYFAPANSTENAYLLSDLFPDPNNKNLSMNLLVEGINPSEKTPIKATLLYNTSGEWIEIASSVVNVRVLEAKVILNTDNDKDYNLDDNDHKIKDQHDGFQGWFADQFNDDTLTDATSTHGFENLFPILLKDLPPLPNSNMKYELRINHTGIVAQHPDASQLNYLKSSSSANTLKSVLQNAAASHVILQHEKTSNVEFLFGIFQTAPNEQNRISLLLYPDKNSSSNIVLDESFYTFRSVDKYFWMGSAWGTPNISFNYPLEDGRVTSNFQTYPDVTHISGFADSYDMTKDILIFLHGFNVDLTSAMTSNRIFFRRLYWSGYRDNYIGIAWNGIYGAEGTLSKLNFDACVEQALRSSRSINKFLAELPKENNINIMAHSLGNLVMWDALRLERYKSAPSVLVFNIISIQAAIWSDMFLPCTSLDYSSEPDPSNNISYSIYDLQRHSWAFWLNQNSRSAFDSYSGIFCNSLTFDDYALIGQKRWNATPNSDAYKRTDYATNYRTPYTLPLLYPLMKNGSRLPYNPVYADLYYKFITDPIGLSAEIGDKNVLATRYGWDTAAHSSFKDLEFYKIIRWYKQIFSTETQIIERD